MIVQFFLFLHKDCRLFPNVDANGLACQFIRFLSIGTKKSPDAGIMCRQCPEIFLDIRTKSGAFLEYPGKLPDVYFNFSAFFPVGLPFGSPLPTESCFKS